MAQPSPAMSPSALVSHLANVPFYGSGRWLFQPRQKACSRGRYRSSQVNHPLVMYIQEDCNRKIKMWEMERKKIKFSEGVLYKDFKSIQDFVLLMSYASTRDVLIYSDGNRQIMVVVEEGHPTINQFREKNLPE